MSAMYWLGTPTTTSVVICYRATGTDGIYCTVGDKTTSTVFGAPTVDDGVIRFDITGLSPNQTYNYAIYDNGVQVGSGQCDTVPEAGTPYAVAFLSCWKPNEFIGDFVYEALLAHSPPVKCVIFQGDTPYIDEPSALSSSWFGESHIGTLHYCRQRIDDDYGGDESLIDYSDPTEEAGLLANVYASHRGFRRSRAVQSVIRRFGTIWQADDHERPGDNATYDDYNQINRPENPVLITANNTQCNDIMRICRQAFQAYYKGNPSNADANNDGSYDDDDQTYFRWKPNDDAEFFCIDTTEYKSPVATATLDTDIIGDTQRTWLVDGVTGSTAVSKIISSPATLTGVWRSQASQTTQAYPQTADSSDNGERDLIIRALESTSVVAFCSGDTHHTHVSIHNGIPDFGICPVWSTYSNFADFRTAGDGRVYLKGGRKNYERTSDSTKLRGYQGNVGIVDVLSDGLQWWAVDNEHDTVRNMGRQVVGENEPTFPLLKTA